MNYKELLAKIDTRQSGGAIIPQFAALRAVVELHEPWELTRRNGDLMEVRCSFCASYEYPCPTIQAIEKELGA